jgi:hypothetical protein
MYGTVAKLTFLPGAAEKGRREMIDTYKSVKIPGAVASHFYVTDADPNVCYLAVLFDSKESYWANARSPQQDMRYREMRAMLSTDPEWHDGEVIQVFNH